ncbi:sensor histidine kinase [Actinomadura miaoliensis]|uniref:histidine kinase n=1 Tax=Actinomadura miaoliensis TaxID=430685 RepID=A0ABP7WQU3_9ACTN
MGLRVPLGLGVSRTDAAVGAVVILLTVTPAFVPHVQPWWVVTLAVLTSVPVLWRNRAMFAVGAVVGGAMMTLALTYKVLPDPPLLLLPYGVLVCVFTFAARTMPLVPRAVATAALVIGVVVSLVVPHENLETSRYLVTAVVAAYALGLGRRARRSAEAAERSAEAAERAARLAERERERRLVEERAAAVERERTRIARDMHDILTHSVGLMVVQAEAGPLVVRDRPAQAEAAFEAIAETGRDAIAQLRLILGSLRGNPEGKPPVPPARAASGPAMAQQPAPTTRRTSSATSSRTAPATTRHATPARTQRAAVMPGLDGIPSLITNARRAGLDAELETLGEPSKVPSDVGVAAYRIVQEALTNTIRHSGAQSVRVRLSWSPTVLELTVTDDGPGADEEPREGHGIIGMRERVAACGGTLDVRRGRPGFVVTARLPIG